MFAKPIDIYSIKIDSNNIFHGNEKINHQSTNNGTLILHPGDLITVVTDIQRNNECLLTVTRIIESKKTEFSYIMSGTIRKIEPTPRQIVSTQYIIPRNVIPAEYFLYSKLSLSCNPIGYLFPIEITTTRISIKIEEIDNEKLNNDKIIKDLENSQP